MNKPGHVPGFFGLRCEQGDDGLSVHALFAGNAPYARVDLGTR